MGNPRQRARCCVIHTVRESRTHAPGMPGLAATRRVQPLRSLQQPGPRTRAGSWIGLTGGAELLGQVEGRTAASVSAWIDAQSAAWRSGVRVVAIDMCTVFVRHEVARVSEFAEGRPAMPDA